MLTATGSSGVYAHRSYITGRPTKRLRGGRAKLAVAEIASDVPD
jgi:hypothetical protein